MEILLIIVWVVSAILFIRANLLAQGKVKKFYKFESFLSLQKVAAVLFFISIVASIIIEEYYYLIENVLNLIVLGLFYLQPTPRISRYLLYLFIVLNLVLILYKLLA